MQINSTNKDNAASVEERVLTPQDQKTRYNTRLNQEKADTRVFLHAGGIFSTSSSPYLLTKAVNTVVLTIAVALFPNFKLKEFWIEFVSGLHKINISIHGIYEEIGHMLQKNFYFSAHLPKVTKYQSLLIVRRKLLEQYRTILHMLSNASKYYALF